MLVGWLGLYLYLQLCIVSPDFSFVFLSFYHQTPIIGGSDPIQFLYFFYFAFKVREKVEPKGRTRVGSHVYFILYIELSLSKLTSIEKEKSILSDSN